jgi:hypothetical protein
MDTHCRPCKPGVQSGFLVAVVKHCIEWVEKLVTVAFNKIFVPLFGPSICARLVFSLFDLVPDGYLRILAAPSLF